VTEPALTRADLTRRIARVARVSHEDIRGDADLLSAGLTSLDVLALVNEWRMRGLPVSYGEFAATPTLDAWWARITHLMRANPYLAA
jgi:bifunctional isochorismate lyase / aryl carrier protein